MSTILYIGDDMTISERYQWAYGFAVLLTSGAYFVWLGIQLMNEPATSVEYVAPLLWTLLASFIVHTFGRGFAAHASRGDHGTDERDRLINQRADALSFFIFSIMAAVPMALGLMGLDAFWMTNALFLAFSLTALAGVGIRAFSYRTGALA
jgi:hypothetical protein